MHRVFSPLATLGLLLCCLLAGPAAAEAEAQDGSKKTTVYGMFRQSAQGGIELTSPQEPGVVYIPFDRGAIMGSVVGIKVRVRGVVRDIVDRQGTSYRILAVDDITPLTAEYGATTIERGKTVGLPGTDLAEVHAYHNKTCFFYPRYAVVETLAQYSDGHTLRVLGHSATDSPDAVCELAQGTPLFEIPNGGDFAFAGLAGDTLLVQNGQPKAVHGLMAVNLATQKQTLDATVVPGGSVDKGRLLYSQTLPAAGRKTACPADKTAVRPMSLELKTGKTAGVGKDSCWP